MLEGRGAGGVGVIVQRLIKADSKGPRIDEILDQDGGEGGGGRTRTPLNPMERTPRLGTMPFIRRPETRNSLVLLPLSLLTSAIGFEGASHESTFGNE